ncbi:MAG: elongation factor 1-alpha [Nitrososphaeria archaeon]
MADKPHINLVFVGHVDSGKSSTVGRLLYDLGVFTEQEKQKIEKQMKELGKAEFEFAYFLDSSAEEIKQGVTIDLSHAKFESNKYTFTIIDAPGHADFIKNMISGASEADAAVLVVDGKEGVREQTIEHATLLKILGVKQLIVLVNKLDLLGYSKDNFEQVKKEIVQKLSTVWPGIDKVTFIPASAKEDQNLAKKSDKMGWYSGPTLLEALDSLPAPESATNLPLRIPIESVYSIPGVGTVVAGVVRTGVLKPEDKIVIEPAHVNGDVRSIEMHYQRLDQAPAGFNIGINIRGVEKDQIKRGDVIGKPDNPPTVVEEFTAQIVLLPQQVGKHYPAAVAVGYAPVMHVHEAHVPVKFDKLLRKIDPKTGQTLEQNPSTLKAGDIAEVVLKPLKPVVIEKASFIKQLSGFAIRDMGVTIAGGKCIDLKPLAR